MGVYENEVYPCYPMFTAISMVQMSAIYRQYGVTLRILIDKDKDTIMVK